MVGLVGPFLTFTVLGALVYMTSKPRVKVAFEEGPRVAEIGPGGEPVYPVGLPHCRRDGLVYPSGTLRCERCRDELAVICPMCGLGRSALVDTCSNCGLVLKVKSAGRRRAPDDRSEAGRRGSRVGDPCRPATAAAVREASVRR